MSVMRKLQGKITSTEIRLIQSSIAIRFSDPANKIKNKEALILSEQRIIPDDNIRALIQEGYPELEIVDPGSVFVTDSVKDTVRALDGPVPIGIDPLSQVIRVGVLPESIGRTYLSRSDSYKIEEYPIAIFDYVRIHEQFYGTPEFIKAYPARDLFNFIVAEAISSGASDITISEKKDHAAVYHTINTRQVKSRRLLPKNRVADVFSYVTETAGHSTGFTGRGTVYLSMNLDEYHRGRVTINKTFFGWVFSIRILSNRSISTTLKQLSIPDTGITFIEQHVMNRVPGLKLFVGPTTSGKNTTILSALYQYTRRNFVKIISVEQPVEILADFIEQIDCATDEEYERAIGSLLRQAPDMLYITEMTERTAPGVIKTANTGKAILSTIHCNRVSEVVSRIKDLTDAPVSQIVQSLETVFFQQLLPKICPICKDEGCDDCYKAGMIPVVEYYHFTSTMKRQLIGLDLGEVYMALQEWMAGNTKEVHAMELLNKGIISNKTLITHMGTQ